MEHERQIERVCKHCGIKFILSKSQLRQRKEKWPVHCSRSCSKKTQHAINHKDKRKSKNCPVCEKEFVVVNYNSDQKYCSQGCSATARFGHKNKESVQKRMKAIIRDKKYMAFLKRTATRIAYKFRRDENFAEEVVQEFFLELCKNHNTTIENVACGMIRKEIGRGVVGKRNVDFTFTTDVALRYIKDAKHNLAKNEFTDYIIDICRNCNEFERKFIFLYIKGFTNLEAMESIRKEFPIGNENFYREKKRLVEQDWSNYENIFESKKTKIYPTSKEFFNPVNAGFVNG